MSDADHAFILGLVLGGCLTSAVWAVGIVTYRLRNPGG